MGNSVMNNCRNKEPLAGDSVEGGQTLEEQRLEARRRRRAKRKEKEALENSLQKGETDNIALDVGISSQQTSSFGVGNNSFFKHSQNTNQLDTNQPLTECQTPQNQKLLQQQSMKDYDGSGVDEESLKNNNDSYFSKEDLSYYQRKFPAENKVPLQQKNNSIRWKQAEVLGMGSFGQVTLGWNIDTGEMMAVKQVLIGGYNQSDRKEKIAQIQSEIEALQMLSNKNIVRYIGVKKTETSINIFLEHVPGGSISSLLYRYGKFNETLIRQFTRQILKGLEYLHTHEIIHRDIKGANVLVDKDGNCKLADFGSAKKIVEEKGKNDSIRGTPYWMAPETIKQAGSGRFADIWSIGCTVIEMATAKPPLADKSPIQAMFHIANATDPPAIPSELSQECRDFTSQCLKINPKERYNVRRLLAHPFLAKRRRNTQRQATDESFISQKRSIEQVPAASEANQKSSKALNNTVMQSCQKRNSGSSINNGAASSQIESSPKENSIQPIAQNEKSLRKGSDCIDHSFSESSIQGSIRMMCSSSDSSSNSSEGEEDSNKLAVDGSCLKQDIHNQAHLRLRSVESALQLSSNGNQHDNVSVADSSMGFLFAGNDLSDFFCGKRSSSNSINVSSNKQQQKGQS